MNWWNSRGYWDAIVGKINESPWYEIQLNKSTDVDKKATILVSMSYIFRRMCRRICCVHLLPTNTTAAELFKSLQLHIRKTELVILRWSVHTVVAMTGWLSLFHYLGQRDHFKCESIYTVIHREMLASWKVSPELNVCRMWLNDQPHYSACP